MAAMPQLATDETTNVHVGADPDTTRRFVRLDTEGYRMMLSKVRKYDQIVEIIGAEKDALLALEQIQKVADS